MFAPDPRRWLLAAAAILVPGCGSSGNGIVSQDLRIDDVDGGLGNGTVVSPSATVHGSGIGLVRLSTP